MLYQKRTIVIEAEQYNSFTQHLEDGFDTLVYGTVSDIPTLEAIRSWHGQPTNDAQVPVPYLRTDSGRCYLSKGDYIITNSAGVRYKMPPGIFEITYTPLIKTTPCKEE